IKNDGKVGIGTASPSKLLEVYGTSASIGVLSNGEGDVSASAASANWWDNGGFSASRSRGTIAAPSVVQSGDSTMTIWSTAYDGNTWETPALIQFFVDGTPGDGDMPGRIEFQTQADGAAANPESTTPELVIKNDGSIGINTATPNQGKLEVKGGSVCVDTNSDDNATSCIANESDMRLKKNVRDLDYSVETLMKLRPVQFDWKYDDPEILKHYPLISRFSAQPHSIGFLAQDVQKLVPEAIESETVGDGEVQYLQLDYSKLIPLMVKAAQEQQGDVVSLQAENEKLKAELAKTQITLADMQDDIKGLKAYTGYGIGKAQMGFMMIGAAGGAALLVVAGGAVLRRRRGQKNT
ncbi:MAG TPA: tail fiber domain-containing protein, partial [Alphaproteobacteria bacterium]